MAKNTQEYKCTTVLRAIMAFTIYYNVASKSGYLSQNQVLQKKKKKNFQP